MTKNKDLNISFVRLVSFFMIISCHILQGLNNKFAFWLNVGVQIFLFISGYLYGSKKINSYKEFYLKRLDKILLPCTILVIIMTVLSKIFLNVSYSNMVVFANVFGFGGFYGTIKVLTHTWFVSYILLCYLITPILDRYFNNEKSLIKLICLIMFLLMFQLFNVLNVNIAWISIYIFGFWYSREQNLRIKKNCLNFICIMCIVLLPFKVMVMYDLINLPEIIKFYSEHFLNWTHSLLGVTIFIILYKISSKIKWKDNKIFKFVDKYSYTIYLTHQIFILNSFSLLFITNNIFINILLIIICSFISGIILHYISEFFSKLIIKVRSLFYENYKKKRKLKI